MKTTNTITVAAATVAVGVASSAFAHGEGVDTLLRVEDGRIVTGSYSHDTGSVVEQSERVFAFEWGESGEGPNIADEPGFFAQPGTLSGLRWGTNFVDAVRFWDGEDFDTVSDHTVTFEFLGAEQTTPTTAGGLTEGFSIPVGAGGFDDHYEIVLNAPTDGSADGVYLISMQAFAEASSRGGVPAPSETFWFVGDFGADELQHDAAIEYVEDVLVPAPGALALTGIAGVAGLRRRR